MWKGLGLYLKFLAIAAVLIIAVAILAMNVRVVFGLIVRYPALTGLAIIGGIFYLAKGITDPDSARQRG